MTSNFRWNGWTAPLRQFASPARDRPFTTTLERMPIPTAPLIPPHEAPPEAWKKVNAKFSWRLALLGAAAGAAVGITALLLGWSAWWWLAVPLGLGGGSLTRRSFEAPASWARK
jgi:fatty acid desaturase